MIAASCEVERFSRTNGEEGDEKLRVVTFFLRQTRHQMSFDASRSSPVKAGPLSDAYEAQATSNGNDSSISNDPWNTSSRHQAIQAASIPSGFAPPYEAGPNHVEGREREERAEENGFGEGPQSGAGWAMGEQRKVEVSGRDELGGRLLLTHKVYFVKTEGTGVVVERRFRDFVYLQDVLVKRYPFRLLPSLPPKRLTVAGKYLISSDAFLERESIASIRLFNQLMDAPRLQDDEGLSNDSSTPQSTIRFYNKIHSSPPSSRSTPPSAPTPPPTRSPRPKKHSRKRSPPPKSRKFPPTSTRSSPSSALDSFR